MIQKLTIEELDRQGSMRTMKISGFADGELEKLKSQPNLKAKQELLDMIDNRNGGMATCWHCGYGIYGVWFDNEFAYVRIGTSCD